MEKVIFSFAGNAKERKFQKMFKWLKVSDGKPYCIHCYSTFSKFSKPVLQGHENSQAHKRAMGTWVQKKNIKPPKIRHFIGSTNGRKYDKTWELEFKWLFMKDGQASCKLCDCFFTTFKRHTFLIHESTQMHIRSSKQKKKSVSFPKRKLVQIFRSDALKEYEIKFSVCIACHSSMRDIDHVSEIIKSFSRSELSGINLHRTKCTNIIKNVVGVGIWEELIEDLKGSKYSLLIDSLEVWTSRYLCLCVKYFSKRHSNLQIEFLGFENLDLFTSESVFKATLLHLQKCSLDFKNCVGFSYIGLEKQEINESILSHFRTVSPDVIFVRCLSQTFDFCCENALKKLPSDIQFLLAEIFRWFKMASPHKDFLNLFSNMNSGYIKPLESITPSHAHWLMIGKCVSAVVDNWIELKDYYYRITTDADQNYYACIIYNMLSQDKYLAYFTFILPIVNEFENISESLNLTNADMIEVYKSSDLLHKTLLRKIFKRADRRSKTVSIKNFVLGSKLEKAIHSMKISEVEKTDITENYFEFVVEANNQLENCLSKTIFETLRLSILHPQEFLSEVSKFSDISKSVFQVAVVDDFSKLESLFDKIKKVNWKEIFPVSVELPTLESKISDPGKMPPTKRKRSSSSKEKPYSKGITSKKNKSNSSDPSKKTPTKIPPPDPFWEKVDPIKFWTFVRTYDYEGNKLFSTFADAVLSIFSIPFNTAFTDCIKSHMSTIKSRLRNRTSLNTVEAILRIRMRFNTEETCCQGLTVTPKMLSLFNKKIYETQASNNETVADKIRKPLKGTIKRLSIGQPYNNPVTVFKSNSFNEKVIPSSSRTINFDTAVSAASRIKTSTGNTFIVRTNISRSTAPSTLPLNYHSNTITSPLCYATSSNLEQSTVPSTWTTCSDVATIAGPSVWTTSSNLETNTMPSSSREQVVTLSSNNLNMPTISYSTNEEVVKEEEDWKVIYAVI